MTMFQFKKGDFVQVINDSTTLFGLTGKVIEVTEHGGCRVQFENVSFFGEGPQTRVMPMAASELKAVPKIPNATHFQYNPGDTVQVRETSWSGIRGKRGIVKSVHNNHCLVTFEGLVDLDGEVYTDDLSFANSELEYVYSAEDIEDFKDLIPMRVVMSAEEFAWLKAKIDADEDEKLPNLRALSKYPPHGVF